jgi:hypothetical protein
MALVAGSVAADSGMSKAIFEQIDPLLSPPLQKAVDQATGDAKTQAQQALDAARDGWRKLSFSIATGVINHLLSNLEIRGVQTSATANAPVDGQTGPAAPSNHQHQVSLAAAQLGIPLAQINSGTGLVA